MNASMPWSCVDVLEHVTGSRAGVWPRSPACSPPAGLFLLRQPSSANPLRTNWPKVTLRRGCGWRLLPSGAQTHPALFIRPSELRRAPCRGAGLVSRPLKPAPRGPRGNQSARRPEIRPAADPETVLYMGVLRANRKFRRGCKRPPLGRARDLIMAEIAALLRHRTPVRRQCAPLFPSDSRPVFLSRRLFPPTFAGATLAPPASSRISTKLRQRGRLRRSGARLGRSIGSGAALLRRLVAGQHGTCTPSAHARDQPRHGYRGGGTLQMAARGLRRLHAHPYLLAALVLARSA